MKKNANGKKAQKKTREREREWYETNKTFRWSTKMKIYNNHGDHRPILIEQLVTNFLIFFFQHFPGVSFLCEVDKHMRGKQGKQILNWLHDQGIPGHLLVNH